MRTFLTIAALALITVEGRKFQNHKAKFLQTEMTEAEQEFINFIVKHRRSYGTKEEYAFRLGVFAEKYAEIKAHNEKMNKSYTLGINQFSDLTDYEFGKRLGYKPFPREGLNVEEDTGVVPNGDVDWVSSGAVTGVKDQGGCGSCWSFSTTGSLEGQYYQKHGSLLSFSEQQLIDCDSSLTTNKGCSGGHYMYGFKYAISNKMTLEKDYPYQEDDSYSCRASGKTSYATISSYKEITTNSESALVSSIGTAPTSVAIQANQLHFQSYTSGILDSNCGTNLDHAVLAVGYGTSGGQDYYKVKNSWGTGWGEKGYIRIARNGNGNGICGIQMDPMRAVA
mmetsp:Transcript_18865/g.13681  ORF Transcript_18865/g.13681 Transcript_18865/m.13681 type:complete len:337 (-) Transcript_18865:42-1052(-)